MSEVNTKKRIWICDWVDQGIDEGNIARVIALLDEALDARDPALKHTLIDEAVGLLKEMSAWGVPQ